MLGWVRGRTSAGQLLVVQEWVKQAMRCRVQVYIPLSLIVAGSDQLVLGKGWAWSIKTDTLKTTEGGGLGERRAKRGGSAQRPRKRQRCLACQTCIGGCCAAGGNLDGGDGANQRTQGVGRQRRETRGRGRDRRKRSKSKTTQEEGVVELRVGREEQRAEQRSRGKMEEDEDEDEGAVSAVAAGRRP